MDERLTRLWAGAEAEALGERLVLLDIEQVSHLVRRPDVEPALVAFGIRIQRRVEAALG